MSKYITFWNLKKMVLFSGPAFPSIQVNHVSKLLIPVACILWFEKAPISRLGRDPGMIPLRDFHFQPIMVPGSSLKLMRIGWETLTEPNPHQKYWVYDALSTMVVNKPVSSRHTECHISPSQTPPTLEKVESSVWGASSCEYVAFLFVLLLSGPYPTPHGDFPVNMEPQVP